MIVCFISRVIAYCYCMFFTCVNIRFLYMLTQVYLRVNQRFFTHVNPSFNYSQILVQTQKFYTIFYEKIHVLTQVFFSIFFTGMLLYIVPYRVGY